MRECPSAFRLLRGASGGGKTCVAVAVASGSLAPAYSAENGAHDTASTGLHQQGRAGTTYDTSKNERKRQESVNVHQPIMATTMSFLIHGLELILEPPSDVHGGTLSVFFLSQLLNARLLQSVALYGWGGNVDSFTSDWADKEWSW